jgi:anaphase-promoting complex subunit 1
VTITVGVLLGMAANKKGTCDSSVTKVLCLHLPSLLPPSFATIEVTSTVQTAAITGIGLLYLKSRHRLMTEFLLKELGKRPTNVPSDREGYSLSCGLALGMINLCLSDDNESGIADLSIEERLHRYIIGGRDDHESFHDVDNSDRLNNVGQGCESERSSLIFEGDTINVDVTAPGAIIALGLMYIRSG